MKILLVSQMYPGPDDPDLGVFVAQLERGSPPAGHEIERAVLDRRGGRQAPLPALARDARSAAKRFEPDVVYAHFLVPAGLAAALASTAPLVVTAHGQDVANVGASPASHGLTRYVVGRASAVIAVSTSCAASSRARSPPRAARSRSWTAASTSSAFHVAARRGEPGFVYVGSLTERKNVVRLARARSRGSARGR